MISVNNIQKSFIADSNVSLSKLFSNQAKRFIVLNGVTFEVGQGELLGVLGRNGAGKSTLLRTVGGIYGIDQGEIITDGEIASIFELGFFFNRELTGIQYCRDYFMFRGLAGEKLEEAIHSIHEFTELGEFFFEPVKSYSSGMQAKLLFGVATAVPAKIILIDEMLVVGDEYFKGKAWRRLQEFLAQGSTGIIVSHDWTSLLKLCRRTVILSNKQIEFIGDTYAAVQEYLKVPYNISSELTFLHRESMIRNPVVVEFGTPFNYSFSVAILEQLPQNQFGVTFSIERHIEGVGWSLAMIGKGNIVVEAAQNSAKVVIGIYDFCLAPGEYLLCIALTSPVAEKSQQAVEKVYEALTWLNGNPIKLLVKGENEHQGIYRKRLSWKIEVQ